MKSGLRRRLSAHVLRLGPAWLGGQQAGELAALSSTGLDALDPYFARFLPQLDADQLRFLGALLREDADTQDRALGDYNAYAKRALRITRLLGDLRKLAELEHREIETAPVDLPELLQEVAEADAGICCSSRSSPCRAAS